MLVKAADLNTGHRILEVGCGSGPVLTATADGVEDGFVCGVDISRGMLLQARARMARDLLAPDSIAHHGLRSTVVLVQAEADRLPFREGCFDRVLMVACLQEIRARHEALLEVSRVLSADGLLAVQEFLPDPDYPRLRTTRRDGERAGFVVERAVSRVTSHIAVFRRNVPVTLR
ncbi:MAG: methyltransferase domain-containing protein [Longimicrobiales bacterium]